jgi:ATP-dependent Zn protease
MRIRLLFGIVSLLVSFLILVLFILGPNGIVDTYKKQEKIKYLNQKIAEIKEQNKHKKEVVENLKNSDLKKIYIKGIGLDLGEGEYVFKFDNGDPQKIQTDTKAPQDQTIMIIFIFVIIITFLQILLAIFLLKSSYDSGK